jgi:hypothetical protein
VQKWAKFSEAAAAQFAEFNQGFLYLTSSHYGTYSCPVNPGSIISPQTDVCDICHYHAISSTSIIESKLD